MAKKTSVKVRLVPENKPDSPFNYYVKKPNSGEKAKVKLKVKKYKKKISSTWSRFKNHLSYMENNDLELY